MSEAINILGIVLGKLLDEYQYIIYSPLEMVELDGIEPSTS